MPRNKEILILTVIFILVDARPQSGGGGYRTSCKPSQVYPGIWNFACDPPADEKVTLNLEHIVQFKNSDLTDHVSMKEINVAVPNYKIRQVIRPQIVEEDGVNATSLKVNIHLLTPEVETDRQEEIAVGHRASPAPPPEVHIKYPHVSVGDNEQKVRDAKVEQKVRDPKVEQKVRDPKIELVWEEQVTQKQEIGDQ